MTLYAVVLVAVFGLVLLMLRLARKEGRTRAELDAARRRADDVQEIKEIRSRIDSDEQYAKRVRDDFTRD